jgi:hypothetical protein
VVDHRDEKDRKCDEEIAHGAIPMAGQPHSAAPGAASGSQPLCGRAQRRIGNPFERAPDKIEAALLLFLPPLGFWSRLSHSYTQVWIGN